MEQPDAVVAPDFCRTVDGCLAIREKRLVSPPITPRGEDSLRQNRETTSVEGGDSRNRRGSGT